VETFSPYARQFMDRMDRPQVDKIEGIPPAIAIDRKDPVRTSRSTVGTMTEITDYAKLLYARLGKLHCKSCGQPVVPETPAHVWNYLKQQPDGTRLMITFPYRLEAAPPEEVRKILMQMGFDRLFLNGQITHLDEWQPAKKDKEIPWLTASAADGWTSGSHRTAAMPSAINCNVQIVTSSIIRQYRISFRLTARWVPVIPAGDSAAPSVSIWI
jgi:excinuclease UvrABC ATPase subunit